MAREELLKRLASSAVPELIDHGHSLSADVSFPAVGSDRLDIHFAVAEAYRSLVATGASPHTLHYRPRGNSSEDEAISEARSVLELKVTENISDHLRIDASLDDPTRHISIGLSNDGDLLYLLGDIKSHVDFNHERLIGQIMIAASRDGLLNGAHAVSRSGFAVALAQMAIVGEKGARFWTPDGIDCDDGLFSNSSGRIICVVPRTEELRFSDMCIARNVPLHRVGVVDGDAVELQGEFTLSIDELAEALR